ncbi:Succinyl-CoA ligase [ADP-forming] subunit beta,succinyl-CoA synthetase subunit beta,Succinyl-CoA synthetase, beta subunit,succinate-CoA ligase, beta subunit,ATP-grasp domain [Chlamydia serpentis]|uniref:Succinate--CoA ligase [ADP-forming] subunit beta n=1 Tax=Chlamydia serpentis TaxID=1967782 RepID=A0A2R8FCC9_9CHLA|nr:ADP-forming succinate--CoA ligase subunit beta [Chlamydia serpentis]SPN74079.1 Succinyl-CoA ligase [ADP-forming] subunit beta,succinyl-CoA synthetase subunit beta,Succinyl-CoA synthetase, beta subunit,succinate-CoA ligase, beta subunit,ATP-grasp domain [Chlamydia serpentis]
MYLHEYQAKDLLASYDVLIPPYWVVSSQEEGEQLIIKSGLDSAVVKVQVHSGGRGKNGGVIVAKSREEILQAISKLLGMHFTSNQTAEGFLPVEKVLISPLVDIQAEYYIAVIMDRKLRCPALMLSKAGGMDIEEVTESHPEQLQILSLSSYGHIYNYQLRQAAKFMGWKEEVMQQGIQLIKKLTKCFYENDASLLEINPLILTPGGKLLVLDAKITIDDNALYRHPELEVLYDPSQENVRDVLAKQIGLSYIALKGNIGCIVNGAGLAMSTLDILKLHGGNAANFLDVGGGASQKQVQEAVSLVLSDESVQVLFINIFGGIMDCSVVASGLVAVMGTRDKEIPTVIRIEGTNVELGKEIVQQSGVPCQFVSSMEEGARLAVALSM